MLYFNPKLWWRRGDILHGTVFNSKNPKQWEEMTVAEATCSAFVFNYFRCLQLARLKATLTECSPSARSFRLWDSASNKSLGFRECSIGTELSLEQSSDLCSKTRPNVNFQQWATRIPPAAVPPRPHPPRFLIVPQRERAAPLCGNNGRSSCDVYGSWPGHFRHRQC